MQPAEYYNKRLTELGTNLSTLLTKKSRLGWTRFFVMLCIACSIYFLIPYGWLYIIMVSFILLSIFIKLVFTDIDNNKAISYTEQLIELNKDEIKAMNGDYLHFDDGASYAPHEHFYSNDLDIFGKASLFQYLNRTTSAMGGTAVANWLLHPAKEKTILERQTAAKELHNKTAWRQSLQAFGKEKKIEQSTYLRLQEWIKEENSFIDNRFWMMLQLLVPAIMIAVVILNATDFLSDAERNLFLIASALLAFFISKKVVPLHDKVSKLTEELNVLTDSIRLIENENFTSPVLVQFQSSYKHKDFTASAEMKKLKGIVQRMDWRLNPVVFVPLAILFQWDLQQVIALEKWKRRNHNSIIQWFEALGNFEAISSLATLHFNHPGWCFPELKKEHFFIEGKEVGHPLINKLKRVNNYIDINNKGIIMLVTGSNMAGKSTYLRSIGVNVVLTMAGAVTCAKSFALSPVQLLTSMRIADNLEENTSTFYAELKKLKTIIEKVNNHEKIFILLDEILRGTNSLDRHTGAVALTKQLIRQQAAGIIATHDVELAKLKEDYPENILNYHFDVQVNNGELYFDYKLKEGICTSLNASILMKKIGIEL
jgi:DNA mismatch repair ATPase MutS